MTPARLILYGAFTVTAHATAPAGATPGSLQVDDHGGANYTVPLQVPPGTAGLQPSLSLSYSSQGGNGLLGLGWGLGGLSAIHRCPATIAQDGFSAGITYTTSDRYCIDGQRLIAINGAYGANGTEYRTERVRTRQESAAATTVYLHPRLDLGPAHFEEETKSGSTTRTHYINAGSRTVALYRETSDGTATTAHTRYLHHDHLGSLDTVTDETGQVLERLSYDAWGKRRTPAWQPDPGNTLTGQTTTRGFSNHEHLDSVGLIHMNGRVYDPTLGRFLTADPYIQAPQNLQSYNRYSYVNNNPLSYTDPSGYFFKGLRKLFKSKVVRAAIAVAAAVYLPGSSAFINAGLTGAAGNIAAGFVSGAIAGGNLKSGVIGAITAGAFSAVNGASALGGEGSLGRILAHGVVGGISSELQGGSFGSGFLSAGFTQALAPAISRINPGVVGPDIGRTIAAAVAGGAAAVLGGGKFGNGAVKGAFSRLFGEIRALNESVVSVSGGTAEERRLIRRSLNDMREDASRKRAYGNSEW